MQEALLLVKIAKISNYAVFCRFFLQNIEIDHNNPEILHIPTIFD